MQFSIVVHRNYHFRTPAYSSISCPQAVLFLKDHQILDVICWSHIENSGILIFTVSFSLFLFFSVLIQNNSKYDIRHCEDKHLFSSVLYRIKSCLLSSLSNRIQVPILKPFWLWRHRQSTFLLLLV